MSDLQRLWTPAASRLADLLAREGFEVRIVGGAVRDALMGKKPKDIDFATDATPAELLELGAALGLRTIPTLAEVQAKPEEWTKGGLKHGTVSFVIDGEVYEVTTLRVDVNPDGRHAEVAFVRDFQTDAARRDITFNALSVDRDGRLHDYFGGAQDLRAGRVRFVGDAGQRIREDYLRILRFFRFRARYGQTPADGWAHPHERVTFDAIAAHCHGMRLLSGERVWLEMSKILTMATGVDQLAAMRRCGVLDVIGLPPDNDDAVRLVRQAATHAAPAPVALGLLLAPLAGPDDLVTTPIVAPLPNTAAAPLERKPPTAAEAMARRWKLSLEEIALAEFAWRHHRLENEPYATFLDLALLTKTRREHLTALLDGFGRPEEARLIAGPLPEFPLKGADLVAAGVPPGPGVGMALARLREAWREEGYPDGPDTRETLLARLQDATAALGNAP